jgi:hypothetical protein
MEQVFSMLLNLVQVALRFPLEDYRLQITSPTVIMQDLLHGLTLSSDQEQVLSTLVAGRSGYQESASQLSTLHHLAAQIEPYLTDDLRARIRTSQQTLDDLLLLQYMLTTKHIQSATIEWQNLSIFDYIQRWDLLPLGEPPTILVGSLRLARDPEQIAIPSDHFVVRRTALRYDAESAYPRLTLKDPSTAPISAMRSDRKAWEQRTGDEYRLKIFTGSLKSAGSVQTTRLLEPYVINLDRIRLIIPSAPQIQLLATDFYSDDGQVLARCLRLFHEK